MIARPDSGLQPNENLILSQAELNACRPVRGEGGTSLRAFCPFHGSDKQRSLRLNQATGRFQCFACGAWGYTEDARDRFKREREAEKSARTSGQKPPGAGSPERASGRPLKASQNPAGSPAAANPATGPDRLETASRGSKAPFDKASSGLKVPPALARANSVPTPARADLPELLGQYQAALPGSLGEEYLGRRGISLELALRYGAGYAAAGRWAHPARDWKWGRLVFPHTTPDGEIINLYGRAVGSGDKVPKAQRHDHLPGGKGYFNAPALLEPAGKGPLFVCEGMLDAISLLAAGCPRVVAIIGVNGWRWEWATKVTGIVFALDADATGQSSWRQLARAACYRGKEVAFLPPESFGGCKDVNEAWVAGKLRVGSWPGFQAPPEDAPPATIAARVLEPGLKPDSPVRLPRPEREARARFIFECPD